MAHVNHTVVQWIFLVVTLIQLIVTQLMIGISFALCVMTFKFVLLFSDAWFTIDLGVDLVPSAYTLRHARGYGRSALRNWQLLVNKINKQYLHTIDNNCRDQMMQKPGHH
jgi:hypothetical protein